MADIATNGFENICRTCLSREGLNPLYEKYLAQMLMTCTVVKFTENDGLPAKICTNCINEITKAFAFAKRCEATDKVLRGCAVKLETEVANNSSHFQKVELTIKTEEETKPAIIYRTVKEVLGEYQYMEDVKQEEDVKMEFEDSMMEVKAEAEIKIECNETYDDPVNESDDKDDDDELQDKTYSHNSGIRNTLRWCTNSKIEKKSSKANDRERHEESDNQEKRCSEKPDYSDSRFKHTTANFQINNDENLEKCNNSWSRPKRRCTVSQIEKKKSKDDDSETYDDPVDESFDEEDENQDTTYSEKPVNSGSRLKHKTFCSQINEVSAKNKMGQHKHGRHSKFSNRINQRQKGILTGKKPHICEVCSKGFSLKQTLKTHMRIHSGEKPYICDVCSKGFIDKGQLKKHMRIHTGEKPYICKVCSKSFSISSNLKSHMRTHSGEKPYICDVCSKGFIDKGQLKKHMRIHTGEKPYICKVCSKSFSISSNLNSHMRTHSGEKPFTCEVCNKGFRQKSDLKTHMRIHTGEKPYICKVCSKAFSASSGLIKHKRVHTGEKAVHL